MINTKPNYAQIVIAKRAAMNQVFWCPYPLYDDNGFDCLMQMSSMDEVNTFEDWGSIFLHQWFQDRNIYDIRRMVWCVALELLSGMCGISQDIAETLLAQTKPRMYQRRENKPLMGRVSGGC